MILDKQLQRKIEQELEAYPDKKHNNHDKWVKVINKVLERFKGEIHNELIEYNYFEGYRIQKQLALLAIERNCYYDKRQDILYYAAFVAQSEGLIKVI